jgi:hypothetical protein
MKYWWWWVIIHVSMSRYTECGCGSSVLGYPAWHNLVARLYGQNILKYSDWDSEKPENLLSYGMAFRPTMFPFHLPTDQWHISWSFLHLFHTVVLFVDTRQDVVRQVATNVSGIHIIKTLSASYSEYESSLPWKPKIPFSTSHLLCRQLTFLL